MGAVFTILLMEYFAKSILIWGSTDRSDKFVLRVLSGLLLYDCVVGIVAVTGCCKDVVVRICNKI